MGGIQWGTASDGQRVYAAITNASHRPYTLQPSGVVWNGGSWAAMDAATGAFIWQVADPGMSTVKPSEPAPSMGPVTVANGVVYVPSMSGFMYALGNAAYRRNIMVVPGAWICERRSRGRERDRLLGHRLPQLSEFGPLGTASNTFYAFSLPSPGKTPAAKHSH